MIKKNKKKEVEKKSAYLFQTTFRLVLLSNNEAYILYSIFTLFFNYRYKQVCARPYVVINYRVPQLITNFDVV